MAALAELDSLLQALLQLKAPGITKSRIASITTLCVENVKSESVLVQKIFTHFKRAPATHKLGVLYVIDAVTRQWIDKAGVAGQDLSKTAAQDGTFAAGIHKMSELLPVMMNDLISTAPYDQKEKISKLVDIWERGNIFPSQMVSGFKTKIEARQPNAADQAPSQNQLNSEQPRSTPSLPAQNPTSLPNVQKSTSELLSSLAGLQPGIPQPPANPSVTNGYSSFAPAVTVPPPIPASAPPPAVPVPQAASAITPEQAKALASVIPPHVANDPAALQQHLQLLQQLVQLRVPPEQWGVVIAAMQGVASSQQPPQSQTTSVAQPPGTQGQAPRNRSRSPVRRRDSPVYGKYQGNDSYRQRSPDRIHTPSTQSDKVSTNIPKWTEMDPTLPDGNIRVLSRTLFVGGTQCNEEELRRIFSVYGEVQTCIPNPEKRHAFVKYIDRAGAVAAKEEMSRVTDPDVLSRVRSVRWGVGFGPRDCNDYQTGISVIPISRLTDADRKWVLTAQYGGSGGKPIVTGLVMEEPDIEIGAGVSSKAISRRVTAPADHGRPRQQNGQQQDKHSGRRAERNFQQAPQHQEAASQYQQPPNFELKVPQPMPIYGLPPSTNYYGFPAAQGDQTQGQGQFRYG